MPTESNHSKKCLGGKELIVSDLNFITSEIDKILGESAKIPSTNEPALDLPSLSETISAIAGVIMEEFPEGGSPELFGKALIEASIGSSDDTGLDRGDIFDGLIEFFKEGINSALLNHHLLEEDDFEGYEEDEDDDYEDDEDDDYEED